MDRQREVGTTHALFKVDSSPLDRDRDNFRKLTPMNAERTLSAQSVMRDVLAGLIVFLVALPLCLGIALASNAPLFSGLISGIVGGILVGILSGSHTSVSGPAAGLTAIVAGQIANLGGFDTFLLAVVLGGVIQIVMGIFQAGALSAFFPSSVIKGLLAAIGVILILKQIPYLLGQFKVIAAPAVVENVEPLLQGGVEHVEPVKHSNAILDFLQVFSGGVHSGAFAIGLLSLAFLILWDQIKPLKKSLVPAPLLVVILGVILGRVFQTMDPAWSLVPEQLVQVPVAQSVNEFMGFLRFPDFTQILNPTVHVAAITVAIVASLETLLNLDAVDKLDRKQRLSPPSRELLAQGCGNVVAGMIGGIPMTSVVIRGSVNVNAGAESKLSTIIHGILLLVCVGFLPAMLNSIPLSCLAAILLMTGFKLASVKLFKQMWSEGRYQFLPFILTLVSIVMTDLLIGIMIGLAISLVFILHSNLRRPIRKIHEKHVGGDILHLELSNQVSFLNRAALEATLREAPRGSKILLDARRTDYIDPDVLSLIREFTDVTAPVFDIQVALLGFRDKYRLADTIESVDFVTQEMRENLTPRAALNVLVEGNRRFIEGHPLERAARHQRDTIEEELSPMVAFLTGIDSRTPVEIIFDLDLGEASVTRVPGNVIGPRVLAGLEYSCLQGAKLIVVMGHTGSSLVKVAIEHHTSPATAGDLTGCDNLEPVLLEIATSIEKGDASHSMTGAPEVSQDVVNRVARRHILRTIAQLTEQSGLLRRLAQEKKIEIVGAMYCVDTGVAEFLGNGELLSTAGSSQTSNQ